MEEASDSGGPVQLFMGVTGASKELAAQYLNRARGDLDEAVARYFEEQSTRTGEADDREESAVRPTTSAVEAILGSAKESSSKGKGKTSAKGESLDIESATVWTVGVTFFEDGFMVDENFTHEDPPTAQETATPAARRTGLASLSDFRQSSSGKPQELPKVPKLYPLRSYDTPENKLFLEDVKSGRVPRELRKRDASGNPMVVSIAVSDLRPKTYQELEDACKRLEQMQAGKGQLSESSSHSKAPPLFAGSGYKLSNSSASQITSSSAQGSSQNADPELVSLLSSPTPTVDESKPVTNVQIRLSNGTRVKARLNTEHTVADLWRVIASEMGLPAFKAATNHSISAGFPPKPLTELGLSLAAADLANAAVTHRCTP